MALPLPARICATYFTLWGGGTRITSVPLTYNQIYLFHAVPAGNGAFRFDYGNAVSAAEIDTVQKRGQRVVLTVGGANAGFNFTSRAQSQAFVDSFKRMYDQLGGVDGCDFNNFEARIGSNPAEMIWISQQLKAAYGTNFSISAPPAPGGGWAPQDRVLCAAMAKAGVMDYAGPQFYDSPDLTQLGTITSLIDEWVIVMGGDASKVVVGLSSNYGGGPTLATSQNAWKSIVTKYPKIRGVFAWSAQDDASGGWNFGRSMGPMVGAQLVTDGGTSVPPAPEPPPPPPPAGSTSVAIAAPVLAKPTFKVGEAVAATAKVSTSGAPTTAASLVMTVRPPGGTHGGGPFIDLWSATNLGLAVGDVTISGSRPMTSADALGKWEIYATWKDAAGNWYDGPSSFFTLEAATAPPPPAPPPAPSPTIRAGDTVKLSNGLLGIVTRVTSTAITVSVQAKLVDLTKV